MLFTELLTVNQELLNLTNDRFYAGLNSEIPSLDQISTVNEIQNQLVQQQEILQQTTNRLAILLGQNPEDLTFCANAMVPLSNIDPTLGLPSELLRRRPDIRNAERLVASATEHVGQAIAAWFPSFSLLGVLGFAANQGSKIFAGNSFTWSVGPAMSWPLLNFGRIKFDIKAKESLERQALLNYGNIVINAFADVENALVSYCTNNNQLQIITQKLSATSKNRDLVASLCASGLADTLELLRAERNRLLITLQLTNVQQSLSSSLIFVYKALGGGWEHV
jgi:NodT family efflux transporter outer membrane factor (OMF) lipoprotein